MIEHLPTRHADGTPLVGSHIDGAWSDGEDLVPNLNPARPSEVIGWSVRSPAAEADRAVAVAADAFSAWSRLPAGRRGEILDRAGAILADRAEEIGTDLAREEGKTVREAIAETRRAAVIFRYFAGQTHEADGATYPNSSATTLLYTKRVPLGTIAVVTPWNFPIAIPAWKIAPALAYGNTVVWKPAELVPFTSAHLMLALEEAGIPPGTVNMLTGSGSSIGSALVASPSLGGITFTGSNAVGAAIRRAAAETGVRVQLELGGKNPAVVLADADLDHAVRLVADAAFSSTGQKCSATSRVIVEEAVADRFAARLADAADRMVIGDPLDANVNVGPLVSQAQQDTVRGFLAQGRNEGRQLTGRADDADREGFFVPPTVLTDLASDSTVLREEIFGPVVGVIRAESYDEAVAIANDTPFGLTSSIFTSSLRRALQFAEDSDAGTVKVNQGSAGVEFNVPFGGVKGSGYGQQEQGKAAAEFYTHWKSVYLDRIEA